MSRRLLVITKDPEFDERGEVVLGQCEPFTSGWKLVLIHNGHQREDLQRGTYTDLRKIQEACASINDPEEVRKRVKDMRALLVSSVNDTVAVEFNKQSSTPETPQLLDPTQTSEMPAVRDTPTPAPAADAEFFEITVQEGVTFALVTDPDRAADNHVLSQNLRKLLENKPKGIVLDLNRVSNLPSRTVNELMLFRDHCASEQIPFGLCNLRKAVLKLLENLGHQNPLAVFPTPQAAAEELLKAP